MQKLPEPFLVSWNACMGNKHLLYKARDVCDAAGVNVRFERLQNGFYMKANLGDEEMLWKVVVTDLDVIKWQLMSCTHDRFKPVLGHWWSMTCPQ